MVSVAENVWKLRILCLIFHLIHVTFEFFNIYVIFLNSMFMFIFSFEGASLTILTNRLTKGTLSYSILTTQWIHVRGFFMPWDNAS